MLNTLEKKLTGPSAGQIDPKRVVELVSVSKWQGVIAKIDRRYVRNESLQTLIELLISVRHAVSVTRGSIQGKPLDPLLKDISVVINRGSVVGVIDIGGRSRSALLQILGNSEPPSRGEIRYYGTMAAFPQIGLISFPHMTCREILERSARAIGVKRDEFRLAMQKLAEISGLEAWIDAPFRRLPKGGLIDLGIGLLCCLDYDVLVVDEVTKPRSKHVVANLNDYLRNAPARGKTVILNSRNLRKLLDYCTHLLLIQEAELLDYGPVGDVSARHSAFIKRACDTPMSPEAELPDVYGEDEEDTYE